MVNHPNRSRPDGPKITKHKDPQGWRIYVGGKPTDLTLSPGDPPRFREPKCYELWSGDALLMQAPSVHAIVTRLEVIASALRTDTTTA